MYTVCLKTFILKSYSHYTLLYFIGMLMVQIQLIFNFLCTTYIERTSMENTVGKNLQSLLSADWRCIRKFNFPNKLEKQ